MPTQPFRWRTDVSRGYSLLRVSLGLNICFHGVVRWIGGLDSFAHSLLPMFAKTPLPAWSVHAFGLVLPVLEAVIGAAIATGFRTRSVLLAGALLMLVLTFGSALRQDWSTVGIQLIYSVVYCILIAGAQFNDYCLDDTLERRS